MTQRNVRIAVDAMGGDLGPGEIVKGVLTAARDPGAQAELVLVGDRAALEAELARTKTVPSGISIRHASQTIAMTDKPRGLRLPGRTAAGTASG